MNLEHVIKVDTDYGVMYLNSQDTAQTPFFLHTRKAINHNELELLNQVCNILFNHGQFDLVDGGSHVGTYPLFFKKFNPRLGQVFSFEPIPRFAEMQMESILLNYPIEETRNMHVWVKALGRNPGVLLVPSLDYSKLTNFGGIEWGHDQLEDIGQHVTRSTDDKVEVVTLESIEPRLADKLFIKLDVEGMEEDVLQGAKEMLLSKRPLLFVEFIKSNQENLKSILKELDYRIFRTNTDFLCINRQSPYMEVACSLVESQYNEE
jgi:FkbM family methyltransferase